MIDHSSYENTTGKKQLIFTYIPGFTRYILDHRLTEYVKKQLEISRLAKLPMLQLFSQLSEEELFNFSLANSKELLLDLEQNNGAEIIKKSLKKWLEDKLPGIQKHKVTVNDIILISYIRKQVFYNFIPDYTSDPQTIIELVKEIDSYQLELQMQSITVFIDIMAETIKEQENFTQYIAEASPTILYLYDLSTNSFLYVNKEVTEVLGYQPENIIQLGSSVGNFLHPEDAVKSEDNYQKYRYDKDGPVIHQLEGRVKNIHGEWKWLLTREIVFKRDEHGKAIQVIGSALDITERKKMEQDLVNKTLMLQQSNASLEEFAHIASHDLQEPLRKISTFGDRLVQTQQDKLGADGKLYLEKIIKSTNRMQQLINDILSLSTISGDKSFKVYSLQSILDEVSQTMDLTIEKTGAVIQSDNLPEAKIIPAQFRQLFQNLLSNSLKFIPKDKKPVIEISHQFLSPTCKTRYNLEDSGDVLQISFKDNGIGFDAEYAEKIFIIFQRLHGKSEYEGTGIGLAICRKIIEHHGGLILAEPGETEGAVFKLIFPVNIKK